MTANMTYIAPRPTEQVMPHDHGHHHDHDHHHAPKSFGAAFAIGTVLNLGLVVAQVVVGMSAHSMALLADAVHNFGDVLALGVSWGAMALGGARRRHGGPTAGGAARSWRRC